VKRLLLVAMFLEVGLLLIIVPWWSALWDQNYFAQSLPIVHTVIANNYVRGAISGLGLVNVYVGLAELVGVFSARQSPPSSSLGTSLRQGE
jgi:hypothetical protein